jgi:ribosomal protein S18 acetylase RimI-like enzyme
VTTTIVGGERLDGELGQLELLAQTMFGGRRTPGWLARKIVRECVDPHSCALLVRGAVAADESVAVDRVVGYALVGRPPSLGDLARGAGVGVLPELRGRGLGSALIEAAVEHSARAGATEIEFLAERERVQWYAALGFTMVSGEWTLQREATGEHDHFEWTLAPGPERDEVRVWSWIAEAWHRTPAGERGWFAPADAGERMCAWASREGRAVLIHRLELGEPGRLVERPRVVEALNRVRAGLPRGTPVLLYPVPARRSWPRALRDDGWAIVQSSQVMARYTRR